MTESCPLIVTLVRAGLVDAALTVKVVVVCPAGTVTVAGTITLAFVAVKETGHPPAGAGPPSVTVAVVLPPASIADAASETLWNAYVLTLSVLV